MLGGEIAKFGVNGMLHQSVFPHEEGWITVLF